MKITDMLVSAIIKKGVLCEARNVDVEFDIPLGESEKADTSGKKTRVHAKVDHITIRFDKEET